MATEVRLEFSYIPSPFKEEKLNFNVSTGAQPAKAAAAASQ